MQFETAYTHNVSNKKTLATVAIHETTIIRAEYSNAS